MDLFFRKYGKGPALIILHGLYGSSDNWVSIGKSLSKHFEVFIIDQRNHGNSPHTREHNYQLLKNDLFDFMEKEIIKKAVLLGHSMGGKTVMHFAVDYPERVESIIVIDISPRSYKDLKEPVPQAIQHRNILNAMKSVDLSLVTTRQEIDKQLSLILQSARVRSFLLKNVARNRDGKFSWKLNLDTLIDQLPEIMDGIDPARYRDGEGISGFPVLFIRGANSEYIDDTGISLINSIFPAAEIISIPDSGHWVHAEQPDLLLEIIRSFVLGN